MYGEGKAGTKAASACEELERNVVAMAPVERAAVLIIAHQMMEVVGRTWGDAVRDDPAKAPPNARRAAVTALTESRTALRDSADWTGYTDAYYRQEAATDLCLSALSFPDDASTIPSMTNAWKAAWSSRAFLPDGLDLLRKWETANQVNSVPLDANGEIPDDDAMMDVRLPGFFRMRKINRT